MKHTCDPNFIQLVVEAFSKKGPFWLENRQHTEDDYFEYKEEVITNTAVAEAAWRTADQQDCHTISFQPSDFNYSPLPVVWHQSERELSIDVQNFWEKDTLTTFLNKSIKPPTTWKELNQQCVTEYPHLIFANDVLDPLYFEPFSGAIAKRVKELLILLNELNTCFESNGKLNDRGQEILKNYFQGDKALFTDESESNKHQFEKNLTFNKPKSNRGETLFCPFHGRIRMRVNTAFTSIGLRKNRLIHFTSFILDVQVFLLEFLKSTELGLID